MFRQNQPSTNHIGSKFPPNQRGIHLEQYNEGIAIPCKYLVIYILRKKTSQGKNDHKEKE